MPSRRDISLGPSALSPSRARARKRGREKRKNPNLRHSFASLAADLGYSEPTIAALVGHKGQTITSRYVHSADAVLLAAADEVADRTAELMGEKKPSAKVVPLRDSIQERRLQALEARGDATRS